jgi:NAD(P)-dependent dehydrogenase (short-subunit alcohol dehydrogenase family)
MTQHHEPARHNGPATTPTNDVVAERYLDGRHAIVTGGSRGIGLAIASELARRGAHVTLMGRTLDLLSARARELEVAHATSVTAVECDVTQEASVHEAFGAAAERFGSAYVLVNNAGTAESMSFASTSRAVWDDILATNLTGPFLCIQQVLPAMLQARAGRIVTVASTAALKGYSHTAAYCAAKHGALGLTRALAVETAKHGVTVNAVCPGYTDTDMTQAAARNLMRALDKSETDAKAMLVRPIPRGVLTQPAEVASAVAWLCSPLAAAVTGIALPVAGGEVG